MQDPDKQKCKVCQKLLKKTSMKKHLENVHGKANRDKKLARALRETAKKAALTSNVTVDLRSNRNKSYAVPVEVDDAEMNRLNLMMADFEFIDIDPEEDSGTPEPVKKIPAKAEIPVKKRQQPELAIQKRLEKQYGCGHKVIPYAIIDILGNDFLIEIKNWDGWIKAIGQVIVYGHVYPNHMKQIHFFGEPPAADKEIYIRGVCAKLGIKVTQEPYL